MIFDLATVDIAADEFQAALVRRVQASDKQVTGERQAVSVAVEIMHRVITLRSRLLATTVETMVLALSYVELKTWIDEVERAAIVIAIYEQAERSVAAVQTPPAQL